MTENWRTSREIVERIVVEGDLVLLTPSSLGNGDSDGLTDMSLLLDEIDGSALLTGTSIAGAVRNYLRECEKGFGTKEGSSSICRQLFGYVENQNGDQSCLIIDDSRSIDDSGNPKRPATELRDGVRIDGKTRTAADKAKFDFELLVAGTIFKLRFELLISDAKESDGRPVFPPRDELVKALATALQGFEKGEIYLGARKRRGYGECKVENWTVNYYNLKTRNGLLAWLGIDETKLQNAQPKEINKVQNKPIVDAIKEACGLVKDLQLDDKREYFEMTVCFALDGSMLIRSGSKLGVSDKGQPDTVHLRSNRQGKNVPVVSGTSLAGVLRHRAVKICNTISNSNGKSFVEKIFGVDMEELKKRNKDNNTNEQPFASRLEVRETVINNTNDLVQTRVKIDRFTGGAFEGALFDAAPVFANGEQQAVTLNLRLRNAESYEIGLLLLLLKDLWTSDLPIGGESSIGRGRLNGKTACLRYRKNNSEFWKIGLKKTDKIEVKLEDGKLPSGETETNFLNGLVKNLKVELEKGYAKN